MIEKYNSFTQNVFMTGATGGIGSKLIESLLSYDFKLYLLCRKKYNFFPQAKNINIITGDLLEPGSYSNYLRNINIILHLGAVTYTNNKQLYYQVNTEATANLVKLSKINGIKRFIYISTVAIDDKGGYYSRSKKLAEDIVINSGLKWVIIRSAEVYGISNRDSIYRLIRIIEKLPFIPIIGDGNQKIAPIFISDFISAIMQIINRADIKNKIYILAGPEEITCNQLIEKICIFKGFKKIKIKLPVIFLRVLAELSFIFLKNPFLQKEQILRLMSEKNYDISLTRKELEFNPIKLEVGLMSLNRY